MGAKTDPKTDPKITIFTPKFHASGACVDVQICPECPEATPGTQGLPHPKRTRALSFFSPTAGLRSASKSRSRRPVLAGFCRACAIADTTARLLADTAARPPRGPPLLRPAGPCYFRLFAGTRSQTVCTQVDMTEASGGETRPASSPPP